jgi:transposase InsO family protein
VRPDAERVANFTGEQRLLLLDAWMRSKLPASEFAPLVGVTATTLYGWRKRFEELGPAALLGHRRGQRGSQLPEPTRRAILMMKQAHPEWGQDRIHDMLIRTEGLEASARAVQRVLLEAGYEVEEAPTRPHPAKAKRFERTRPNELWQTDLFSFLLKRQRCRVHLVFAKLCERRGIRQIVASPRRPQTLGKIERFWGTLWRELVEGAIFRDLEEARTRLKHFLGYYNFQRTHQGLGGLVPADRYFEAAPEVRATLEKRVADNARSLALHGEPRKGVYLTGRVGGETISLHSEGGKVVLTGAQGVREEVDLQAPGRRVSAGEEAPGTSVLDGVLEDLAVREPAATQEASDIDQDDTRDEKEDS